MKTVKKISLQKTISKYLFPRQGIFSLILLIIIIGSALLGGMSQIENQRYSAILLSHMVEDRMDMAVRGLQTLAGLPTNTNSLKTILETNPYFDVVYQIKRDGKLIGIYPPDGHFPIGRDMSAQPFFYPDANTLKMSSPFISSRTGNPTVYISLPASEKDVLVVGELNLIWLQEGLIHSNIFPIDEFYTTDQNGYLIIHPQYDLVRQRIDIRQTGIIEWAKQGQNTQIYFSNKNLVIGTAVETKSRGWWTIVETPVSKIYTPFLLPSLLGLALSLAAFLLVIWQEQKVITNRIVAPLINLTQDAEHIAQGNFTQETSSYENHAIEYEELFRLRNSFENMKQAVQQRQLAVAQSEEKFRFLFNTMAQGVILQDANLQIVEVNQAACHILGLKKEQLIGSFKPEMGWKLVHEDKTEMPLNEMPSNSALESKGTVLNTLFGVYLPKENIYHWIISNSVPWFREDTEKPYLILTTLADVSELREIEEKIRELNTSLEQRVTERTNQLETANRELEAFSYSVSHDLRAPLRKINGFSQLLIEDFSANLNSQGQEYLNKIIEATQRMSNLIDDLLKLSRLIRSDMQLVQIDLGAISQNILAELKSADPGREIEIQIADDLLALADASLIRVALDNLLRNAWKFTRKTKLPKIEVGKVENENGTVYFIKDNGAGFEMKYVDKLFNAFQRLHTEKEFEGTGIGLAMVQRIIKRHNGKIWAESTVGQGATFYFTLK
jgi:PAS domain S-box-containing protein